MSEVLNSTTNYYEFRAHQGENLIKQVDKVMIIMYSKGMQVAGFSAQGDLLISKVNTYKNTLPDWIIDFFEHYFIEEELLQDVSKLNAIFWACDKQLLVPEAIYKQYDAEAWLKKIYFLEHGDEIMQYKLLDDACQYLYVCPTKIKNIINRYFPKVNFLPIAAYQFYKPYNIEAMMQCCVADNKVYATLYKNKTLSWHQAFDYTNVEDIAYQFALVCKQYRISKKDLKLKATVTHKGLNTVLQDLTQYFPHIKFEGENENMNKVNAWSYAGSLLQQLHACVS